MEKEYQEKRIQDDIERKEFEQKCLAKFDADKRTLEEEQRTAVRKLEAQHVQLRVDMEKSEMERKAQMQRFLEEELGLDHDEHIPPAFGGRAAHEPPRTADGDLDLVAMLREIAEAP